MELYDLENEVFDLENQIVNLYQRLDLIWVYHPSNPNFVNPIKAYEEMKTKS